ncbi:hypothetical protein [Streptomyces sp. NPDC051079]|uniref:hypothetical protein n=1 Tax=Streptomyces sp. NPDC051079 TaxID=3155043 RepID=UPI00344BD7AE
MTLNITIASRWLMAQSSDFRLTSSVDGVVSETSQKQVVLQYAGWSGLVCYTGVARFGNHDTAAWLTDVLTHDVGQRSPEEIVKKLVSRGSDWLRQVPAAARHHTFTMITYEGGTPYVYMISNVENPNEAPQAAAADKLFCTRARARRPRCLVTGWAPSVLEAQRQSLLGLIAEDPPPEQLREAVAMASRAASGRAQGTVGQSCVVAHLRPDGSGEAQVFGNLVEEFLPTMITQGYNVASPVPAVLVAAGSTNPHRLVGATWNANGVVAPMVGAYRDIAKQSGDGWPLSTSLSDGDK